MVEPLTCSAVNIIHEWCVKNWWILDTYRSCFGKSSFFNMRWNMCFKLMAYVAHERPSMAVSQPPFFGKRDTFCLITIKVAVDESNSSYATSVLYALLRLTRSKRGARHPKDHVVCRRALEKKIFWVFLNGHPHRAHTHIISIITKPN